MPLQAPNLDDRRFAEIVRDARALIPNYLPEWTDHNLSDPGMTLIQLFAWMTEMTIYRLNRVPDLNYTKFLQMIGVERKPAAPAKAEITFHVASPDVRTVIIPRGTRIGATPPPKPPSAMAAPTLAPPAEDEPLVFETDEPLIAIGAALDHVVVFDGVRYIDNTTANGTNGQFYAAFGKKLRVNNALYLGFTSNNPFPTDEMNFTIRVHSDPARSKPTRCDGGGFSVAPPANVAWEYFDGTFWRRLDLLSDETNALTRSGHLYFRGPSRATRSKVGTIPQFSYWLRCRLVDFQYELAPELDAIVTNTVRATAVTTARDEVIGSSDGGPDQIMLLRHSPVYARSPRPLEERLSEAKLHTAAPPTEQERQQLDDALITRELVKGFLLQVDEGNGLTPWEEVENFYNSGPEDHHYVLNRTTGEVQFGNRAKGAIPLAGLNNVLVSFYQYGGGTRGNVGPDAIRDLQTAIDGVDSATNRWSAEGGQDEELLSETLVRAPQELKARDRAVTVEDFRFLALETPGVRIRRALALPLHHPNFPDFEVPGVVTIIVVPDSVDPKPVPSESTMKAVCSWLDERRLLTSEVFVAPPRYKLVRVVASIRARATVNAARVKADIEQALTRYLHPLEGGEDHLGWPLGGTVRFSDLFRVMFQIDGVATVDDLRIVIDGDRKGACENAEIPKDFLLYSVGHDISVTVESSGT